MTRGAQATLSLSRLEANAEGGLAQRAVTVLGLAGIYFTVGKLALTIAFAHPSASPVWPPTGIALAALLVLGYRAWPGIFLGAFLVNVTTAGNFATSAAIAAGNTLEAVVGVWLATRYASGRGAFDRARDTLKFALYVGMGATALSATVGVTSLALGGYVPWSHYGAIWLTWWLGDATGAVVVTPGLVLWTTTPRLGWIRRQKLEAALLALSVVVLGTLVFQGILDQPTSNLPMAFLCLPVLGWAAYRFGPREAATAALLMSAIAVNGTLRGFGPFVRDTNNESLLILQTFMGVIVVMATCLGAVTSERRRAEEELRRAHDELEWRVRQRTEELRSTVDALLAEVSARRRAEEGFRESELRLAEAQALVHLGSWNWDVTTDQVYWSDELYRIHGLEPGSTPLQYMSFVDWVHPEDRAGLQNAMDHALRTGERFDHDYRVLRPDGGVRWLHARCEPVLGPEGRPLRMHGTCHDITVRRRREDEIRRLNLELERRVEQRTAELRRTIEELEQFAYVASHDLQEPLRMVSSFVQLLAERYRERLDEEGHEFIRFAVEGATRMHELINALLAYSRLDKADVPFVRVSCEEAIEGAFKNLQVAIRESGAEVGHGPLPEILGDPSQIVQLFQNLVGNAIKFRRKEEPPRVRVEAERVGDRWAFSVRDNGIGMAPDHAERIFVIFQRLHGRGEYPGTGIGLAICKRIVELHRGTIWVESSPGRGSVFRFTLPRLAAEAAA